MGTPEDVACEKHFTPHTLTEMFLTREITDGTGSIPYPSIDVAKGIFKEWLRTVLIPYYPDLAEIKHLLIILVDEP